MSKGSPMDEDDIPGLFQIEGSLLAGSRGEFQIAVHSPSIQVQADFQDDSDWFSIGARRPFFDYEFQVYLPEDGFAPIQGNYQWAVLDEDLNVLDSGEQIFRVPISVRQFSTARFLRITADANTEIDSTTGQPVDVPAFYRVAAGLPGDAIGNSIADAQPYESNWNGHLASSINSIDDVDFYSVELDAGTEYQFSLYDRGFEQSSLIDPVFELHDENGLVQQSLGRTSTFSGNLIQFTAPTDKTYYLKVATNDQFDRNGSYFIRSPQFDDDVLPGYGITKGVVNPGETFTNSVDFEGDIDWARLNMRRHFTYMVDTTLTDDVSLVTRFGSEPNFSLFDDDANVLRPFTQDIFVQFSGEEAGEFEFSAIDVDEDTDLEKASFRAGEFPGAIETAGDVDLFRVSLVPFSDYRFSVEEEVVNEWSNSLVIQMLNDDGTVARSFDITEQNNSFTFTADEATPAVSTQFGLRREQLLRVMANNEQTTGYQLTFTPTNVDSVPDRLSTSELATLTGGVARFQGVLEGEGDWDVHRVELKANKWYELGGDVSPSGLIGLFRATDVASERVDGSFLNGRSYFRFQEAGTYYLAAGASNDNVGDGFAGYDYVFKEDAVPIPSVRRWRPEEVGRSVSRFGRRNTPTEIWSEVGLVSIDAEGVATNYAAGETHDLTIDQWNRLELAPEVTGAGDIFYRNKAADGRRLPWEKFELVREQSIPEFADYSRQGFTYSFASELPDDLINDPRFNTTFEPANDSLNGLVTTAIDRWRNLGFFGIRRIENSQSVGQVQIFLADLGADADVLSLGSRGDLILNSQSEIFTGDFSDESMFKLLRRIGTSLGLPTVDSVDRFVSVMGTADVAEANANVWPTYPMPADTSISRVQDFNFTGQLVYPFPETGSIAASVLARPFEETEVNAEDVTLSVSIDLRPGQSSSVLGSPELQVIHMAPSTFGYKGVGGPNNDGIRGNARSNVLIGNAGNDVIDGGSGADQLFGGSGDDYYLFKTASGNDLVDEEGSGGTDVLRIEGMYDYDSIAEDFTFRRFGNDLLVRLELDGQRNNSGDQIRIRNMGDESSRVEALALLNTNGFVNRISLQSVWEQADEVRRRFQIVAGNDGFGTLVSPVS